MNLKLTTVLAACLIAAPALAGDKSDSSDERIVVNGQKSGDDLDKKVCVREVSTGSIMPRRVCRTGREVAAQHRASEDALERMRPVSASGISKPE